MSLVSNTRPESRAARMSIWFWDPCYEYCSCTPLSVFLSLSLVCVFISIFRAIFIPFFLSFSLSPFFFFSQVLCGPRVNPCLRPLFSFLFLYTSLCIPLYPSHFVYFSRSFKQYFFLSFFLFRFRGSFFNKNPKPVYPAKAICVHFVTSFLHSGQKTEEREGGRKEEREGGKEKEREWKKERERER